MIAKLLSWSSSRSFVRALGLRSFTGVATFQNVSDVDLLQWMSLKISVELELLYYCNQRTSDLLEHDVHYIMDVLCKYDMYRYLPPSYTALCNKKGVESQIIVYLLGGGIFDVSLLSINDGVFEVLVILTLVVKTTMSSTTSFNSTRKQRAQMVRPTSVPWAS